MKLKQVILAIDNPHFLNGIIQILKNQVDIVAAFSNSYEMHRHIKEYEFDYLLLDDDLSGLNSRQSVPVLLSTLPQSKIIILSQHNDDPYIERMYYLGAWAYILKECVNEELLLNLFYNGVIPNSFCEFNCFCRGIDENRKKILIVDDFIMSNEHVRQFFERKGFIVRSTRNVESALQLIEDEKFDLVISDYMMPGMDGIELTSKLRSIHSYNYPPVVILSSTDTPLVLKKAIQSGVSDWLKKPLNRTQTELLINKYLNN
jgi:DNA-binding NarL/FixJ family response regulator